MNLQSIIKPLIINILLLILLFPSLFSQSSNDSISINLPKAIEIGLSDNPTMRIDARNIQIKKYYKKEQIAALFPNAYISGNYNRTIKKQVMTMDFMGNQMEIEIGTDNNYAIGLNIALPIIAPTLWQNLTLSQLDIELTVESARASKISLIREIKKAFYAILIAQESYDVLKKNYDNVKQTNQLITNKFNEGLVSEFEKLRSDVQLKNQLPQLTAAENAISLSTMMLKILIGVDLAEPLIFEGNLAQFEEEMQQKQLPNVSSFSLLKNSTLKQMELNTNVVEVSKKMILSSACPTLSLGGNYQYMAMNNNFKFSEYNWIPYSVIGLSLNIPIVSWASTSFKLKQNKLLLANMEDQKTLLERNLRLEIQNNLNNIQKAIDDLASHKETMTQAEKAYEIVQKQYDLGMATWLDLSSAELSMTGTRLNYYQSIYSYLAAYAELDAILGNNE